MKTNSYKSVIENLLNSSGITIDGVQPFDLQIHNEDFYQRILRSGSLGLGEAYVEGWWDCNALEDFFFMAFRADLENKIKNNFNTYWQVIKASLLNLQTKSRSLEVGKVHYDAGNDLYKSMLDKWMMYSCA